MIDRETAIALLKQAGAYWNKGYPPHPYDSEWFIAKTIYRERVVLKRLPEEYSYDFKTADETYMKKENVIAWMQFPDSEFIAFTNPPVAHSRKDAEPVEYFGCEPWENAAQPAVATMIFPSHSPDKPFVALGDCANLYPDAAQTKKLYAHPPEADKLLQQALEYAKLMKLYGPKLGYGNTTIDDHITAIRTYLEGKK